MDTLILKHSDRAAYPAVFDAMHRQRHQVFAEGLGWSALRAETGREVDQFDDEHAVYLLAMDRGEVCGSLRLLPAWRRCMVRECWPEFLDREGPEIDESTWEWSRWCPGTVARPRQLLAARSALILAALRWAEAHEVERFLTFCDVKFVDQLEALGWRPHALGPTLAYAEGMGVAVEWTVAPDAVSTTAARLTRPGRHGSTNPRQRHETTPGAVA